MPGGLKVTSLIPQIEETGEDKDKILEVKKGKVGFEMGLNITIDIHSNKASRATGNSDSNAF